MHSGKLSELDALCKDLTIRSIGLEWKYKPDRGRFRNSKESKKFFPFELTFLKFTYFWAKVC